MFQRFGGVDQHSGDLAIEPTSAADIRNLDLHPVGDIRTRGGLVAVEHVPGGTGGILSLDMLEIPAERYMYAAKPGGLYKSAGSSGWTWTNPKTWTAATKARFAHARFGASGGFGHPTARGAAVYCAFGTGIPWVDWGTGGQVLPNCVYGTGTTGVAGVPVAATGGGEWRDWATYPPSGLCLVGRGTTEQMFAWGFPNDPNRIDYSCLSFPWHFCKNDLTGATTSLLTDGGYFYALADESDVVVGVVQVLSKIVVFKRRTTIIYSGYPGDNLGIENIYPVGCTNYESVVRVGNQLMWWSDQGPVTMYGVQEFGDLQYACISDPVRKEATLVGASVSSKIFAVHDRRNMRVAWFMPNAGSSKAVVYYYDSPQRWTIFDGRLAEMACAIETLAIDSEETTIYGGSPEGDLYTMFTGADDAGVPIVASYVTSWQSINDHDVRKRMLYLDLMYGEFGAIGATVDVGWDYSQLFTFDGSVVRVLGNPASGWDDGLWCSEADYLAWLADPVTHPLPAGTALWDATTQMIARYSIEGTGFIYRLKLSSDGSFPMHFAGWRTFCENKGER